VVSDEPVDELYGSIVPALRASILCLVSNHALTRVATHCRRFAPLFFAYAVEAQGMRVSDGPASKRRHRSSPARQRGVLMSYTSSAEGAAQESCRRIPMWQCYHSLDANPGDEDASKQRAPGDRNQSDTAALRIVTV